MKTYCYWEYTEPNPLEITEEGILDFYWITWKTLMEKKFGPDHPLITKENCIDDWVVVNWAIEKP